ncbi:MAG: nitroreductase family protein [Candidatus Cloacimonadales bacterium]
MLRDLVIRNRSYRRFDHSFQIDKASLLELVDLARLSPSAANLQPLKFGLVYGDACQKVFPHLAWAGYLTDWSGPIPEERPSAYIIIKREIEGSRNYATDAGIACQSILLGASEKGWGGCIFGAVDRENLQKALQMPDQHEIVYVIALGKPIEEVMIEEIAAGSAAESVKYWRDDKNRHHVPKRKLSEITIDYSK